MKKGNYWGCLIRQLREEQHVSQRELAAKAKVNRSTLRRIEEGTARGSIDDMERLFGFLGYELDALTHQSRSEHLRRHAQERGDPALLAKAAAVHLLSLSPMLN